MLLLLSLLFLMWCFLDRLIIPFMVVLSSSQKSIFKLVCLLNVILLYSNYCWFFSLLVVGFH